MERRKILLGSGAALATIVAGCSSSETGDDDPSNDSEDSLTDHDDDDDYDDDHDADDDDDRDDDHDDIPGYSGDVSFDSDKLSVESVERKDDTLDIVVYTDTTDSYELRKEFEKLGDELEKSIDDPEAFIAEINTLELIIEYDGSRVLSVYVDVQWVIDYMHGDLTEEELGDKVYETKD
ncbi:hypothetical protein [Natronolimnobius baerhuensis]|uniref:Uncharacterized protein n=1 Tax=Natronolimnobius baerhuensis TaxID=253108 RepID=A0A202EAH3_9EURY|nr:hypothetical protein [Natronolimnobius baerhuensis]OVE85273.1 hypothetical protein B2G88_00110 [Natronolimnobius baerhuensis]